MLEQSINLSQQKSLYLLTGGSKLPFNLPYIFRNVLTECILTWLCLRKYMAHIGNMGRIRDNPEKSKRKTAAK